MLTRQGLLSPAFLATVGLTEPRPDAGGQAALCVCAALRERGSEIEMALSALSNLVPGMTARAPSKAPEQVPPVTMPQGMGVNPVDPGLRAHLRVLRSGEMQGPFAPPPTQAQAAQHRMSDTAAIGAMGMAPPPTFPMVSLLAPSAALASRIRSPV